MEFLIDDLFGEIINVSLYENIKKLYLVSKIIKNKCEKYYHKKLLKEFPEVKKNNLQSFFAIYMDNSIQRNIKNLTLLCIGIEDRTFDKIFFISHYTEHLIENASTSEEIDSIDLDCEKAINWELNKDPKNKPKLCELADEIEQLKRNNVTFFNSDKYYICLNDTKDYFLFLSKGTIKYNDLLDRIDAIMSVGYSAYIDHISFIGLTENILTLLFNFKY